MKAQDLRLGMTVRDEFQRLWTVVKLPTKKDERVRCNGDCAGDDWFYPGELVWDRTTDFNAAVRALKILPLAQRETALRRASPSDPTFKPKRKSKA